MTDTPESPRLHLSFDFYPWTFLLGVHFDPHVVRTGDLGMEECWDLHLMLVCFEFVATFRVRTRTYYRAGDCMLDLIGRDQEAHPHD